MRYAALWKIFINCFGKELGAVLMVPANRNGYLSWVLTYAKVSRTG